MATPAPLAPLPAPTPAVLLIGTLDTKGAEIGYVRDLLREEHGLEVLVLDSGILGEPRDIAPEIGRAEVAGAAGPGESLEAIRAAGSRGAAVERMRRGVARITVDLYKDGRIGGVLCIGGAEGSVLGAAAVHALPVGVPKLVVSPLASGRRPFGPLVGTRDVMVLHSVVDILGLNPLSRAVFRNAAGAMAGMVRAAAAPTPDADEHLVGVTMLGNTTTAVMHLKGLLEEQGYTPVVFHANGVGGPAMEELIVAGHFRGIVDYTPQELSDNIVGGFHVAGPGRMEAAVKAGLPLVVVASCLDFSVHGPRHTVPERLRNRRSYYHNPEYTLVRLTGDEMEQVGHILATKLNRASGPTVVVVPHGGFSIANVPGGDLFDPAADDRFFAALDADLRPHVRRVDVPDHANSVACATVAAREFSHLMGSVAARQTVDTASAVSR